MPGRFRNGPYEKRHTVKQEVNRLIERFKMKPHPEGGFFGAGNRSGEFLKPGSLPGRYPGARNLYSSIHFLITTDSPSRFHRLRTDELWHFYTGAPILIHLLNDTGKYQKVELTNRPGEERFQFLVRRNTWFAATVEEGPGYGLSGCSLAPGFEFEDFELGRREELVRQFPDQQALIERLTGG